MLIFDLSSGISLMQKTTINFFKHLLIGFVINPGILCAIRSMWIFENFSLSDPKFWTNIGTLVVLTYSKLMLFELVVIFIIFKAIIYFTGYNRTGLAIFGGIIHAFLSWFLLLGTYLSLYFGGDSMDENIFVITLGGIYGVFLFPRFLKS